MQNSHDTDGRKPYKTYKAKGARRTPRDEELAGAPPTRRPREGGERPEPRSRPQRTAPPPHYERYRAEGAPPVSAPRRPAPRRRRRRRWWILPVALVLVLLIAAIVGVVLAWPSYKRFDRAVDKSNQRLDAKAESQLAPDNGLIAWKGTTVLLLGVDAWAGKPGRSDTIMLMHFDARDRTVNQLSIARDTRVTLPNGTADKINAAMYWGGPAMAIETVRDYTGIVVNHVMVIDFKGFKRLVNQVGGVDLYVPKKISTVAGKEQLPVTFEKGMQHMDGYHALLYVRIRHADDDLHRANRQQQFVQALQKQLAQPSNIPQLADIGKGFMSSVATDLTTNEILELSFLKWRSTGGSKAVLAGEPGWEGGVSYICSAVRHREGADRQGVSRRVSGATGRKPTASSVLDGDECKPVRRRRLPHAAPLADS